MRRPPRCLPGPSAQCPESSCREHSVAAPVPPLVERGGLRGGKGVAGRAARPSTELAQAIYPRFGRRAGDPCHSGHGQGAGNCGLPGAGLACPPPQGLGSGPTAHFEPHPVFRRVLLRTTDVSAIRPAGIGD